MTVCQFGHTHHDTITVDTIQGPMMVYDTRLYNTDRPGWCPGRHNVCDRLRVEGWWEPDDTRAIRAILENGDRDRLVIDFGAHCGWYTIMAAKLGYRVLAIDGQPEHIDLLAANVDMHNLESYVTIQQSWIDERFVLDDPGCGVELVKVDLEGNDRHAVMACWPFIDRVHNFYVEISPEFRSDYPVLVDSIRRAGFTAYYPNGSPFDDHYVSQINLRFSR